MVHIKFNGTAVAIEELNAIAGLLVTYRANRSPDYTIEVAPLSDFALKHFENWVETRYLPGSEMTLQQFREWYYTID